MAARGPARARRLSPLTVTAAAGLGVLLLAAVLGPELLSHRAATVAVGDMHQGPGWSHPFGTDAVGRDVFARVVVATRLSLLLALAATVLGTTAGVCVGALPFLLGRRLGRAVAAAIDLSVSFPGLLLAMFLAVIVGVGAKGAVVALSVAMVPSVARLTHTLTMGVANSNYVVAAKSLGVGPLRLVRRHVIPNIAEPLLITTASTMGSMLLSFAGLSYIGFGVQAPRFDWGRMLNEGLGEIYVNPLAALGPGLAVVVAGLVFNLVGEAASRALSESGGRSRGVVATEDDARAGGVPASTEAAAAARPAGAVSGVATDPPSALAVEGLTVSFHGRRVVRDVHLRVRAGEVVGVVGESGSGKTMTALAVADLLPPDAELAAAGLAVAGRDILAMPPRARRAWLATHVGMVFQNPMAALNPVMRVGHQVAEAIRHHGAEPAVSRSAAHARTVEVLRAVRLRSAETRVRSRPHELSGGMRQRVVIAMGTVNQPPLVIADEPTTALDVSVQRQVLDLIVSARERLGSAVVLISHDIAVIAGHTDRVVVMYAGRVVEEVPTADLASAAHPYTVALIRAVPHLTQDRQQSLYTIPGRPPATADTLPGCPFAPRCERVQDRCHAEMPPLEPAGEPHRLACWNPHPRPAESAPSRTGTELAAGR